MASTVFNLPTDPSPSVFLPHLTPSPLQQQHSTCPGDFAASLTDTYTERERAERVRWGRGEKERGKWVNWKKGEEEEGEGEQQMGGGGGRGGGGLWSSSTPTLPTRPLRPPPPQPFRPHRYPTSSSPAAAAAAASVVLLLFPLLFTDLAFPLRLSPSFDLRSPPRRLPIFFWLGDLWDPSMPKRGGGGGGGGRRDELKEEMPVDDAGGEEEEQLGAGGGGGAGGEDDKKKLPASSSGVATQASVAARGRGGGSGGGGGGGGLSSPSCQAERCTADLTEAKRYHRRHKVCEAHSKAAVVMVAGIRQRFCQQCSRFHELSEFDEAKRSCRRRLAGHNERRRKSSTDPQAEGSNRCRQVDQNGRMQITLPANPTYKHFQIR